MLQKNSPYGINFDYKIIPTSWDIPQGKNKKNKRNNSSCKKGFSLIEVLLAVFVVSAGMIGVLNLMSGTLKETFSSRDQIVATLLAQEGVELVRNLRDNNWINERDSFDNPVAGFPFSDSSDCRVDCNGIALSCSFVGDKKLYIRTSLPNTGFYDHDSSGVATKFSRKIEITYKGGLSSGEEAKITSKVVWGKTTFPASCTTAENCVMAETTLTRWGGK